MEYLQLSIRQQRPYGHNTVKGDKTKMSKPNRWNPGTNTGGFEAPEAGTDTGILIRIIDIGTHTSTYQGQESARRKVVFVFELPNQKGQERTPLTVSKFYTFSMHEKANLRRDLETWRGKPYTSAELEVFDPARLLGQPCLLTLKERTTADGKLRIDVAQITSLAKEMSRPGAPVNETYVYDLDDHNPEVFEKISDGLKRLITASAEWPEVQARQARKAASGTSYGPNETYPVDIPGSEEDIPF
jgi:hypothetical protein